jgi:hypothetical protein
VLLLAVCAAGSLKAGVVSSSVSGSVGFFNGPDLGKKYCSDINSCSISFATTMYNNSDGLYYTTAPSPQMFGVEAYSRSSVYNGEIAGNAAITYTDTLVFTGGSGSGNLLFTIEYSGREISDSRGCCSFGNAKVAFNNLQFNIDNRQGTTTFEYPFTFGMPFAITMSASAYSSGFGHEFAETDARIRVDSITVLTPEPTSLTLFCLSVGFLGITTVGKTSSRC